MDHQMSKTHQNSHCTQKTLCSLGNFNIIHQKISISILKANYILFSIPQTKNQVFRIKPPMCITKEDADLTLNVFEGAVKNQLNN